MIERHMRYTGPVNRLHGKTALVLPHDARITTVARHHRTDRTVIASDVNTVIAQFDDTSLEESHGWHGFPACWFEETT